MALIACPDCARQVSDLAVACPVCARPIAGHLPKDAALAAPAAEPEAKRPALPAINVPMPVLPSRRDLAGKPCPRCGKDLGADYVMVSETTGEYRCLECVEKSERRAAQKRMAIVIGTRALIVAVAIALVSFLVVSVVKDFQASPSTTSKTRR